MKRLSVIAMILATIVLGCSKDKLETKPGIKVKSTNSDVIVPGSLLRLILEFADKEGDLGKGEVTYIRHRTNIRPIPGGFDKADTVRYPIPEFPDRAEGEIQLDLQYDFLDENPNENDTMFFKIAVVDRGGHASDTITTGSIIARQN